MEPMRKKLVPQERYYPGTFVAGMAGDDTHKEFRKKFPNVTDYFVKVVVAVQVADLIIAKMQLGGVSHEPRS